MSTPLTIQSFKMPPKLRLRFLEGSDPVLYNRNFLSTGDPVTDEELGGSRSVGMTKEEYIRKYRMTYPYLSPARNDFARIGGRFVSEPPPKLASVALANKRVGVINALDLERIDGELTSLSQIELGRRYANGFNQLNTGGIAKYNPAIWVDATTESNTTDLQTITNKGTAGGLSFGQSWSSYWSEFTFHAPHNDLPAYQFKQTGYRCRQNPFEGEEAAFGKYVFFVFAPTRVDSNEGKLFMQTGANARFLCHFPWYDQAPIDGQYWTIFDYDKLGAPDSRISGHKIKLGRPYVGVCAVDGLNKFATLRINGEEKQVQYKDNFTSPNGLGFYIGGAGTQWVQEGYLHEMIVIPKPIGHSAMYDIESYLSLKWNIELKL